MDIFSASTSTSTSTSATPNNNQQFDVFINHRGPDTKKTFASHLYRRLRLQGFQAFLDQRELQQGDNIDSQIEAAIKSASVHVAIFSPRYAESRWCLEELLLMIKTGATIIPVFYNVKPSQLRWTQGETGLYAQALHKHEQKLRYDPATLQKWGDALSLVADKSGFELEGCNGDEGELLEKVVERVLKKVKTTGLDVAKYPTGLDDKVKEFENAVLFQQQHNGKPQIFGIVGLGGVGKTTLAKEFFNRKNSQYPGFCFLFDVRDHATKGSLHLLQSKLLKNLTGLNKAIDSVDEGIVVLKKHLSSTQVFVILDDVDNVIQLDAFLPIQTVIRSDSLILITSRDKAVLINSGVKEASIYKLNGLEAHHSRQLFCFHAFSRPDPLPGFGFLVDKFIEACDGLPLSLKVIGALLFGIYDQSEWENRLDSFQQVLPTDIQGRLKISYDTLNEEEQKIFLDIACFFIGENRDKALWLWVGFGSNGFQWFRTLHHKCLLELDSKNNIFMHDHLRDMGRAIAKDSNLNLPSRVCCSTHNFDDVLRQSYNEQAAVRGIMVDRPAHHPSYRFDYSDSSDFVYHLPIEQECMISKMSRLERRAGFKRKRKMKGNRLLGVDLIDVEDGQMERILRRVQSPNLKWLRWHKCPYSSLPSWIPMKNLTFMEVWGRRLKTLWQDESQVPFQLRELHIHGQLSNIPKSIGQLKHLERIIISSSNAKLEDLPEEFCQLRSLKVLLLMYTKLKSLPDSFGDLINLEHLDLFRSGSLERLPNSFGNLIKLKYLSLSECENLTISCQTLGNISTLEHLNLYGCMKMEVLPPQVAQQRSLVELDLRRSNLSELSSAMGDLSVLEFLKFGSYQLHSLLHSLPALCELKSLKRLELSDFEYLPDSVGLLTQLTELAIKCCWIREVPFLSADSSFKEFLPRLQHLEIWWAQISEMSFSGVFPNLRAVYMYMCYGLKKIEGFSCLADLQKVVIYACHDLEEVPSVEHCRSLRMLHIIDCPKLQLEEEVLRQLTQQGCHVKLSAPSRWPYLFYQFRQETRVTRG